MFSTELPLLLRFVLWAFSVTSMGWKVLDECLRILNTQRLSSPFSHFLYFPMAD